MRCRPADLRQQAIVGAADLIARRGLRATSIRELARYAEVPLGSTYHYFPGGKQELAVEAVRYNGAQVHAAVSEALKDGPVAGVGYFCAMVRDLMVSSDFLAGCTVLAVAVEGADREAEPPALNAAAEVFTLWENMLAESFREHGVAEKRAADLATTVVAALEGSVGMSRAMRNVQPLDNVTRLLHDLVANAVSSVAGHLEPS